MVEAIIFETGSRKTARAHLRLKPNGKGRIYVNGKRINEYFKREDLVLHALEPLKHINRENELDIVVKLDGGGLSGQAGAFRHALARALAKLDPEIEKIMKEKGFLTRDPREKERMKYGLSKRRRAPQYSKR